MKLLATAYSELSYSCFSNLEAKPETNHSSIVTVTTLELKPGSHFIIDDIGLLPYRLRYILTDASLKQVAVRFRTSRDSFGLDKGWLIGAGVGASHFEVKSARRT